MPCETTEKLSLKIWRKFVFSSKKIYIFGMGEDDR